MTDSGSYTFDKPEEPKKQRVLFRFDNDEPHEIGTMCYRDWETDRKSTRLNSSHRL